MKTRKLLLVAAAVTVIAGFASSLPGKDKAPQASGHQHIMNVRRGPKGMGVTAQKCGTCHQEQNVAGRNMPPGAPNWHLPPPEMPMIWQGLTNGQICAQLKDPRRNGKKTIAEIVHHMAEDKLVMWGWNPGDGRVPVPMPHAEFAQLVKAWADGGAACPK